MGQLSQLPPEKYGELGRDEKLLTFVYISLELLDCYNSNAIC